MFLWMLNSVVVILYCSIQYVLYRESVACLTVQLSGNAVHKGKVANQLIVRMCKLSLNVGDKCGILILQISFSSHIPITQPPYLLPTYSFSLPITRGTTLAFFCCW